MYVDVHYKNANIRELFLVIYQNADEAPKRWKPIPKLNSEFAPFGKGSSSKPSIFQGRGVIRRVLVSTAISVENCFSGKVRPMWRPGEID